MELTADARGVVRVFIPEVEGEPSGHIALVKYDSRRSGAQATVVTMEEGEVLWLDKSDKGDMWEWLHGMSIEVSYLDEKSPGRMIDYRARVVNWDLDKFLLCVEWEEDGEESNGEAESDWISLVEDEWRWIDGRRPDKSVVKQAFRNQKKKLMKQMKQRKKAADPSAQEQVAPRQEIGGRCEVGEPSSTPPSASRARARGGDGRVGKSTGRGKSQPQSEHNDAVAKKQRGEEREPFDENEILARIRSDGDEAECENELIVLAIAAVKAVECGCTIEDRCKAANCLRRISQRCGVRGLLILNQLGAVPLLVNLMDHEDPKLHEDVVITLINLSLYHGCRSTLLRSDALSNALRGLGGDEGKQLLALSLLQNLSLVNQTHGEIMSSVFLEQLPKFLSPTPNDYVRHTALAILQHLSSNADHAGILFETNILSLLFQELSNESSQIECRLRALSSLVNLSGIDPSSPQFTQISMLSLLSRLQKQKPLKELVDLTVHNIGTSSEQLPKLQQAGLLKSRRKGETAGATNSRPGEVPIWRDMRTQPAMGQYTASAAGNQIQRQASELQYMVNAATQQFTSRSAEHPLNPSAHRHLAMTGGQPHQPPPMTHGYPSSAPLHQFETAANPYKARVAEHFFPPKAADHHHYPATASDHTIYSVSSPQSSFVADRQSREYIIREQEQRIRQERQDRRQQEERYRAAAQQRYLQHQRRHQRLDNEDQINELAHHHQTLHQLPQHQQMNLQNSNLHPEAQHPHAHQLQQLIDQRSLDQGTRFGDVVNFHHHDWLNNARQNEDDKSMLNETDAISAMLGMNPAGSCSEYGDPIADHGDGQSDGCRTQ